RLLYGGRGRGFLLHGGLGLIVLLAVVLRNLADDLNMLAVHADQRLFEVVGFLAQRDELLFGKFNLVAGMLLTVLGADGGGTDDLGRLLLGLFDDVFTQALGVDHRGAQ